MKIKQNDKIQRKNKKKRVFLKTCMHFLRVDKEFLIKIFPTKTKGTGYSDSEHSNLKIVIPKQMLQRLPIALAQVKAGNNSENSLNEIRQIVYSFYQSKEITKKVYNNITKSIQIKV